MAVLIQADRLGERHLSVKIEQEDFASENSDKTSPRHHVTVVFPTPPLKLIVAIVLGFSLAISPSLRVTYRKNQANRTPPCVRRSGAVTHYSAYSPTGLS